MLKNQIINKIRLKSWKKSLVLGVFLGLVLILDFPQIVFSQGLGKIYTQESQIGPRPGISIRAFYDGPTLPNISQRSARTTMNITVTSYNSEPGQTDDTPFITAFNTHVRDGIVATNFLAKGTLVRFPDEFGDKTFVVEDRMNSRYHYRMDIWMENKQDSKNFGVKYLKMEIL
ncbi:3D domain-containing protein [bacterium]|jgi:3D (Asp-Asp-Asp) domain-containing protein|nr:3D domain-containing protein [bacterium]MBT4649333.1 3D domain-containing protein [bacterium]